MSQAFLEYLQGQINLLKEEGLYKKERRIDSQQQSNIRVNDHQVINFCANNYLGLANEPWVMEKAQEGLERYGYGMASVRFICGTQSTHKALEARVSQFLKKDDSILYSSCFDANTGLFETLLGPEDAIISDALNHASIIDGIRLCKATRLRYANNDMQDLEVQLQQSASARFRLIVTDGVFSMDGILANLPEICALAERYQAMVMVDDSHAVGFMGPNGGGTPEYWGVEDKVTLVTGTLGKALGGASGGYVAGPATIIEWLRQRSRPYLFSNTLAPLIAYTSLAVLDALAEHPEWAQKLHNNSQFFREGLSRLGFTLIPGEHPIIPVMLGDAALAARMADMLLDEGIYVIGFSFPVVPKGLARIRTQISAAHSRADLEKALAAFEKVGRELKVIQ
ncbi:MAG: glycine C-acetyltransferase [Legionellaceae bacterium]|nr:glycine C-acetyltransferase [Legionellaceae bacterium]